jgi:hypothetical protein
VTFVERGASDEQAERNPSRILGSVAMWTSTFAMPGSVE